MKESRTTNLIRDLTARLQHHDAEMSKICKVLEIQFRRIAQLQSEVDALQGRDRFDARRPLQTSRLPPHGGNGGVD